jgi:hypothetical protein
VADACRWELQRVIKDAAGSESVGVAEDRRSEMQRLPAAAPCRRGSGGWVEANFMTLH